jgi:hypothetical protein
MPKWKPRVNVFISYSSGQVELAARIARSLREGGEAVFFDREALPPGETYDSRIREAIEGSDLFLFLVDPAAISPGSYALAELGIAERASERNALKVLPVMVADTSFAAMPPYLRSVTVLQPRGDVVAEALAAIADVARELRREQVSVSATVTNSGWMLNFFILEQHLREVFYRFGDEAEFRSTGFSQVPDRRSGLPQPRLFAMVPPVKGTRELLVKYIDSSGRERGPYRLVLDANEQLVASVKQVLEVTKPWVAFREYPEGQWLAYFTHLLAYKAALREIQYSVDNDTLSSRVRFTSSPGPAPGIGADDEVMVKIPPQTRYVCVKLVFIDGSEWPAERFGRS